MAQLSVELKGDQRLSYMTLSKGWGVAGGRRGKGDLDTGSFSTCTGLLEPACGCLISRTWLCASCCSHAPGPTPGRPAFSRCR